MMVFVYQSLYSLNVDFTLFIFNISEGNTVHVTPLSPSDLPSSFVSLVTCIFYLPNTEVTSFCQSFSSLYQCTFTKNKTAGLLHETKFFNVLFTAYIQGKDL